MVKKGNIEIFTDEIFSSPPMKLYPTNKTIKSIDDTWSSDL